ncbi:MAG: EAL domain-containing protein [Myxococcales bacterium]|nr:EAL domain-containing protein [Myxococcales bacterium]
MATSVILAPGECLFRQGDAGRDGYIIVSGRVLITAERRGVVSVINDLGPGEMLGELAIIDGGPRTATATAQEPTELSKVTNSQIAERIARADPVLALLIRQVIRHLRREIYDFVIPPKETPSPTVERMRMEGELGWAVEREQLELWYQPILDLQDRRIAGFEALVRWRHPERGLVSPAEFIPLAEESGLIVPIGAWVMREGAKGLRTIEKSMADGQLRFMSVNVSGRQLEASGLLEDLRAAVEDAGIRPDQLHLELTEGVLIQNESARNVVPACKDYGVGLFLDDFGTGYSSLAYLHQMPFDALKIDHSFAKQLESEGAGLKLIRAIVGLANMLGHGVVMEGVETPAQRDAFRAMGGKLAQGYLFSKPRPMADLLTWLHGPDTVQWGGPVTLRMPSLLPT